jgi:hypothetical protein
MNQKGNFVTGNQSSVRAGVLKGVTEGTIECALEDLSVHNAEMIKGGPAGGGVGGDIIVFDIIDSLHGTGK